MSDVPAGFVTCRQSPRDENAIPEWRAFPVDALPEPLRDLAVHGATAIGCDASFIALPLLSVAGAAIGNSRTIELKEGWSEPAVVWTATVGESGDGKTPALNLALAPLRERDEKAQRAFADAMKDYKIDKREFDAQFAKWRKDEGKGKGKSPVEPTRPNPVRFVVVDITVEALAGRLSDNPRGLLLGRDELAGWLRSFDAYRGGRGGDAAFWLSAWSAAPHSVDRKGDPPTIYLPRASVWITGGIQPGALAKCVGREHTEDGLLARILLAKPPRSVPTWTDAVVSDEVRRAYAAAIDKLLALEMKAGRKRAPAPVALPLSNEAKPLWITFHDAFVHRRSNTLGDESAALAKLLSYAARFALIHQLVRDPNAVAVDADAIRAGATLAEWFADEVVRVYAVLRETPAATDRRQLLAWIAAPPRSGRVTARDLSRGPREYRRPHAAEDALAELVSIGRGDWEDRPAGEDGGRSTRVFVLRRSGSGGDGGDAATVTEPPRAPAVDDGRGDGTPPVEPPAPGSVTVATTDDSAGAQSVADTQDDEARG